MFDVGFSELMLIAVVALLVLGPERLPRVARTAGHLLGRLQRYVNDVKVDINREMQLDELRKMQQQIESSARDFKTSVNQELAAVETDLNQSIESAIPAPMPESLAEPPAEPSAGPSAHAEAHALASTGSPQLDLGLGGKPSVTAGKS